MSEKLKKVCKKGHTYFKSSNCPTCPKCENEKKAKDGFLIGFGAPAQRALKSAGITDVSKLKNYTEKEILALHGFGPSSLPQLKAKMLKEKISFKK